MPELSAAQRAAGTRINPAAGAFQARCLICNWAETDRMTSHPSADSGSPHPSQEAAP